MLNAVGSAFRACGVGSRFSVLLQRLLLLVRLLLIRLLILSLALLLLFLCGEPVGAGVLNIWVSAFQTLLDAKGDDLQGYRFSAFFLGRAYSLYVCFCFIAYPPMGFPKITRTAPLPQFTHSCLSKPGWQPSASNDRRTAAAYLQSQRVHVGIWYILRPQRGSHIPTLRPKYIPHTYMDPFGMNNLID